MEIKKSSENGKTVFSVAGRIDTQTAPDFQAALDEVLTGGEKIFTIDFKDVEYMSSAGLRAVLHIQKRVNDIEGASLTLINVNETLMEVFEMTGFTDFLTINPEA